MLRSDIYKKHIPKTSPNNMGNRMRPIFIIPPNGMAGPSAKPLYITNTYNHLYI